MTVALALLLGSITMGWLAPRLLRLLSDPVVAVIAWLTSVTAVMTTSGVAMVLLLPPEHGLTALRHCWESVRHGTTPTVEVAGPSRSAFQANPVLWSPRKDCTAT